MANWITGIRILCAAALLFTSALSPSFLVLYLLAGLSDMLDGQVARKTNTVSEFGSRLDTAADFAFVAVCLIKLLPVLRFLVWILIWTVVIAMIKGMNIITGYRLTKSFVACHTRMNKVTGALLFILPLTLSRIDLRISGTAVCLVATIAALQEGRIIRNGRGSQYDKRRIAPVHSRKYRE